MFSLVERKLRGSLINVHKYLEGGSKKDGARPFSVMPTTNPQRTVDQMS